MDFSNVLQRVGTVRDLSGYHHYLAKLDADDFLSQIDTSIFTYNDTNLKSSEIVKCYQIEMQRYLKYWCENRN